MSPEQIALTEWASCSESSLRGELRLWGYKPSEIINKQILINMLSTIYFGGDYNDQQ